MSSRTVQIPRGLLAALVTALALAVLIAVFLLGRESAGSKAPVATTLPPASIATAPEAGTPASSFPFPAEAPPGSTVPAAALPLPLPGAAPAADPGVPEREEVTRYFQESESVQARAKYWSDPQALARTLLEQASSGNTSAFDDLVRSQQQARLEMERLTPPSACAEYHRRSLNVMAEGLTLLEQVQGAMSGGDPGGLQHLAEKGRELEQEARAIDELGKGIRLRFGL